jgi:hypothetical protein
LLILLLLIKNAKPQDAHNEFQKESRAQHSGAFMYMYIMENLMIMRDDHMKYEMFERENKGTHKMVKPLITNTQSFYPVRLAVDTDSRSHIISPLDFKLML